MPFGHPLTLDKPELEFAHLVCGGGPAADRFRRVLVVRVGGDQLVQVGDPFPQLDHFVSGPDHVEETVPDGVGGVGELFGGEGRRTLLDDDGLIAPVYVHHGFAFGVTRYRPNLSLAPLSIHSSTSARS